MSIFEVICHARTDSIKHDYVTATLKERYTLAGSVQTLVPLSVRKYSYEGYLANVWNGQCEVCTINRKASHTASRYSVRSVALVKQNAPC